MGEGGEEIDLPAAGGVHSLLWDGDTLVDWVAGDVRYRLDGTVDSRYSGYGFRFDKAIASPSMRFVALMENLGTKAALLDRGKVIRELNRSFYRADVYEYPLAFLTLPDGREAIAHCPREYCRIDVEIAETGECLTDTPGRKPDDFFHSRLSTSPGGTWLASAGWFWHPFDTAAFWRVADVLRDPSLLDTSGFDAVINEIQSVAFLDEDRIALAMGPENLRDDAGSNALAVISATDHSMLSNCDLPFPPGTLVPFGEGKVLSLYEHPRLLCLPDGAVIREWPHIATGKQTSSIVHHIEKTPHFARHPTRLAFAVAAGETIKVVQLEG